MYETNFCSVKAQWKTIFPLQSLKSRELCSVKVLQFCMQCGREELLVDILTDCVCARHKLPGGEYALFMELQSKSITWYSLIFLLSWKARRIKDIIKVT